MKKITLTLIAALCVLNVSFAAVIYVDDDATGTGSGADWTNAYTDLQAAIDAALIGDEIWVAKGIYYPTKDKTGNASPADSRTKTFYINKAISIHGNFNGTETSLLQRVFGAVDPTSATSADVTILSGDLLGAGGGGFESEINASADLYVSTTNGLDNAFTVVHVNTFIGCSITGCVITAGNALGNSGEEINGAGMYIESANTVVAICYFAGCLAGNNGAGIYSNIDYTISSCSFFGNIATSGGGMYNDDCSATLNANAFILNNATDGGAVYNMSTGGTRTFSAINSIFYGSHASGNGGAIHNNGSASAMNSNILNCTFTRSNATAVSGNGGAIYSVGTAASVIYNSIFYNNAASAGNVFYNSGVSASTVLHHSLLQGATTAAESIGLVFGVDSMLYNLNPEFVDISLGAIDLTLKSSSPCINHGNNAILGLSSVTTDLQGDTRFYCGKADLGALERSNGKGGIVRNQVIELNGSTQYVDIGNVISDFNDAKDFTIEAWVNVTAYDGTAMTETILTNRNGSTGANFCIAGTVDAGNAGKLALRIGSGQTFYSTSTIPAGEWTHVAATFKYNGSNTNVVHLYINGHLDDASSSPANDVATSSANTLIGYESSATDAINAQIEELRIWSDVRTTTEIQRYKRLLLPCGADNALATYEFNNNVSNALELSSAPAGDYAGTAMGSPTYATSTIPLSLGCASNFSVTGAGTSTGYGLDGSALSLVFGASNNPNGNVVISYLNETYSGTAPINPILANTTGQYVVDNYGINTGLDYTAQFNMPDAVDLSSAASEYSLEKRASDATDAWEVIAGMASIVSNTSGSKAVTFTVTGESFSQLMPTLGNVLPVEMTIFEAVLKENQVYLDWQTGSELNNLGFDIEKSIDGRNWENIGFVEGNGTTYDLSTYQFIDENPIAGINYYRLKQMDTDGQFEYSEIRTVRYGEVNTIAVYPNPIKDIVTVDLNNQNADIQVFDLTGRLLINSNSNNNAIQNVDFSTFENGVYILRINGNGWQKVEKIIVQH